MAGKNTAVFGIYEDRLHLDGALEKLRTAGYRYEDVSVLLPENLGSKELATTKASKAPEGATAGAATGAVVGGALGWLAGIGALAIPGVGPFMAAGPVLAALAGIGAVGAAGGIAGALVGMGIPEFEAKRYEGRIRKGGILLSVHCDDSDWTKRAKEVLESTGAEDISSSGESSADFATSDRPYPEPVEEVEDAEGPVREERVYPGPAYVASDPSAGYSDATEYESTTAPQEYNEGRSGMWDQMEGKWKQMKGAVKEKWGKLTNDDLDVIAGKKDQLIGKIQERYGITRAEAERQVSDWKVPAGRVPETDVERHRVG